MVCEVDKKKLVQKWHKERKLKTQQTLTWEKHRSNMFSLCLEKPLSFQMLAVSEEPQLHTHTSTPGPQWVLSQCSVHTGWYSLGWCHTWCRANTQRHCWSAGWWMLWIWTAEAAQHETTHYNCTLFLLLYCCYYLFVLFWVLFHFISVLFWFSDFICFSSDTL